jgi:hypothetical protein
MFRRVWVLVLLLAFILQSCTRTIDMSLDAPESFDPDAKYTVVTTDGREFQAEDLVLEPHLVHDQQIVSFYSANQHYSFARNEIKLIQRIEIDKSRTAIALTVVAAVVVGLIALVGEWVKSLPGGD